MAPVAAAWALVLTLAVASIGGSGAAERAAPACAVDVPSAKRIDCGYLGIGQPECEARACCWAPRDGAAWCFDPPGPASPYLVTGVDTSADGRTTTAALQLSAPQLPSLGKDFERLTATLALEAPARLRLRIAPAGGPARWEVPRDVLPRPEPDASLDPASALLSADAPAEGGPFYFGVARRAGGGRALFNSSGLSLVFKPQYLEIGTALSPGTSLYGLGERTQRSGGLLLPRDGRRVALWASDTAAYAADQNLYGSHPLLVAVEPDGSSHGLLLVSSNAVEAQLNADSLVLRAVGGIIDLYVFAGPTPHDVTAQLQAVTGRPALPPLWALGFHQCRWGYRTVADLAAVLEGYAAAGLPLEALWSDIDWMDRFRNFVSDPERYPEEGLRALIDRLHGQGRRWVPIIDAGVAAAPGYIGYESGLRADAFVRGADGQPYLGQVWPGPAHWPDFLDAGVRAWWSERLQEMHQRLPFDGIWLDMNEPSSFCSGDVCKLRPSAQPPSNASAAAAAAAAATPLAATRRALRALAAPPPPAALHAIARAPAAPAAAAAASEAAATTSEAAARALRDLTSCALDCAPPRDDDPLSHPPYSVANGGGANAPLGSRTVPPTARHKSGALHYDAHNLFGHSGALATAAGVRAATGRRPFVLARSTFAGSGAHAAHWSGDNAADWDNLRWSVQGLLNSNLAGIALAGSDICGFQGDTNPELCTRWISAGAFYTFCRGHNAIGAAPQELYRWPDVAAAGRAALSARYRLLPYLYTQHWAASAAGGAVAMPLFFAAPGDAAARGASSQWLLGWSLLVSPVLQQGAGEVAAYFPAGSWYPLAALVDLGLQADGGAEAGAPPPKPAGAIGSAPGAAGAGPAAAGGGGKRAAADAGPAVVFGPATVSLPARRGSGRLSGTAARARCAWGGCGCPWAGGFRCPGAAALRCGERAALETPRPGGLEVQASAGPVHHNCVRPNVDRRFDLHPP